MTTKKVLITGTTSGIGFATAEALFRRGYHLVMANRNRQKSEQIYHRLKAINKAGKIDLCDLDLASFKSIRQCIEHLVKMHPHIYVVVNNAGVFSRHEAYTEEGFELAMGVNYLGTCFFTEQILKHYDRQPIKIIMVSSVGSYLGKLKLNPASFKAFKHPFRHYFNAKLANLMHANHLRKRYLKTSVSIQAADPGIVYSQIWKWKSKLGERLEKLRKKIMKSPQKGAESIVRLIEGTQSHSKEELLFNAKKAKRLPKLLKNQMFCDQYMEMTQKVIFENSRKRR